MRRWLWPVVAITSALAAQLAWAGPADDATISVTPFSVTHTHQAESIAQCEPGERATGGGVDATLGPAANNKAGYWTQFSEPLDSQGSTGTTSTGDTPVQWHVSVDNHATGDDEDFNAIALCSQSTDARIVARRFHLRPTHTHSAKVVACPSGERALGGGAGTLGSSIDEVNFHELLTSGPLDSTGETANTGDGDKAVAWRVGVYEAGVEAQTLKAFVVCSADSHAIIEATSFKVRRGHGGGATATCPHGRRAVGGGVGAFDQNLSGFVQRSAPVDESGGGFENGDVASGWSARVENVAYDRGRYRLFAVCEPD